GRAPGAGPRRPRGRPAGCRCGRGPRRAHRSHRTARWCATCPAVPARFPCPCTPLSGATGRPARPQDTTIVPDGAGVTGRWVRRRSAAVGGDRSGPLGLLELADRGDLHPVELPDLGRGPRPPDGRERPTGDVEGAGERLRVPDGTPGVGRGDVHTVDEQPPGARPERGRRRRSERSPGPTGRGRWTRRPGPRPAAHRRGGPVRGPAPRPPPEQRRGSSTRTRAG